MFIIVLLVLMLKVNKTHPQYIQLNRNTFKNQNFLLLQVHFRLKIYFIASLLTNVKEIKIKKYTSSFRRESTSSLPASTKSVYSISSASSADKVTNHSCSTNPIIPIYNVLDYCSSLRFLKAKRF